MVKIAIAGGSGNVASEVVDVLAASGKHEILLLIRKDPPDVKIPGAAWIKTDYHDLDALAKILEGVNTLLSFIVADKDPGGVVQKNLIDAAVRAGVKRFAPSEWATSSLHHMPWYQAKADIRAYLAELNKERKVLEYTLFQPGLFTNYLGWPHRVAKHLHLFQIPLDYQNRRALVVDGQQDARITLTTVSDLTRVVAAAIDYEGEWPVDGGIRGEELTVAEIIALGEKLRGPFSVEKLSEQSLLDYTAEPTWVPRIEHPSLKPEQVESLGKVFLKGLLLGMKEGNFVVSDTWNRLLPELELTRAEAFLAPIWTGKD
ncbi:hypothetical protein QBC47DRAFT_451855 [Echria macrotheca]|uniref:NmrA-like domain-containing protein n=1 Tax=Echria macrotheca TaxID=438768 RepID=A0AAJ0FAG3_9PEZI|nr:hypothetical protein QBC47DRAFT_451855 [Echria macrotheca]